MNTETMDRVSKENPCPVCGKHDWCLRSQDDSAAICQRIEQGSKKRCGDAGWLHVFRDDNFLPLADKTRWYLEENLWVLGPGMFTTQMAQIVARQGQHFCGLGGGEQLDGFERISRVGSAPRAE